MLTKLEKNALMAGFFKGTIPDNVVWVYLDKIEKHHLKNLIHEYYMYYLDNGQYMYYFNEAKEIGFVVKLHKEEGKDQ